jgi:hypothetical protein
MTMTRNMLIGAALAAATLAPATALADAHSEVVNAETHAGLAAGSADVAGVHAHLQHALNCLAGPGGNGFDAKAMNPCANAGKGAIPDTTDAAKKAALESAAAKLRDGLAANDVAGAKKAATDASAMLKKDE